MNETIIIFHSNCPDGYGSYWAANKKFGKSAKYWSACHGDDPPDVEGCDVYLLDFCYQRDVMETIAKSANKVVVIDHHVSAEKNMVGIDKKYNNVELNFDMSHSGAVLSWQYFHPGKPVPVFLKYIEDRDLWKWELADSRLFLAGIGSYSMTLATFDKAAKNPEIFIKEGNPILRYESIIVEKAVENPSSIIYDNQEFMVLNNCMVRYTSAIGSLLCSLHEKPAFIWYYDHENNQTVVSIRSNDNISFDASIFASKQGGGGHRNAAGFSVSGMINFKNK